jgi:cytochrome c oxidase subunit 4
MADTHHAEGHHGPDLRVYMVVATALAIFTLVSFVCNWMVRHEMMTAVLAFVIILSVAIVKSCLVGLYFMHLKYDWAKLYFVIVPISILATMMVIVLMPDIVVGWQHDAFEKPPAAVSHR